MVCTETANKSIPFGTLDTSKLHKIPTATDESPHDVVVPVVGSDKLDWAVQDAQVFREQVLSNLNDLQEAKLQLERTRAVTTVSNRLTLCEDEKSCYEQVAKLLVELFQVNRSSFALMVDDQHFTVVSCAVTHSQFTNELTVDMESPGKSLRMPIQGTGIEKASKELCVVYVNDTRKSQFKDHIKCAKMGLLSAVNIPILVEGSKFAGTLNVGDKRANAFSVHDRMLLQDIARSLGANIHVRRLQAKEKNLHHASQQLLHSLIHPKILDKISHFWQDQIKSTDNRGSIPATPVEEEFDGPTTEKERMNAIKHRLEGLKTLNHQESIQFMQNGRKHGSERSLSKQTALYAEDRSNVCIIFTDIVKFSKMASELPSIQVMDVLTDLFHRFDKLCEIHGLVKLETIGDAFVCCSGLFDEDDENSLGTEEKTFENAAKALQMAIDMALAAEEVWVPHSRKLSTADSGSASQSLKIRVGLHCGDITMGVLGQKLPKLSLFGSAVNHAARMEQTAPNGMIQVSETFHDLIQQEGNYSFEEDSKNIKNMGTVKTYVLDPHVVNSRNASSPLTDQEPNLAEV